MAADNLLEQVYSFAVRFIPPGSDIVVAVSAGSDSMALLHLLWELRRRLGIGRIGIAHVNHGLRGAESDGDERFVAEVARAVGVALHVHRLSGRSLESCGMEAWAREQRYRFLDKVRAEHGYALAATGHTADDQAETMLLRLGRGCGLRGLAGIHARRDDGVVRPLLRVRRETLREWLAARGFTYREDSSNRDLRFARNRVRHGVLAEVSAAAPECVSHLAEAALAVQEQLHAMRPSINKWICEHVVRLSNGRIVVSGDAVKGGGVANHAVAEILRNERIPFSRGHIEAIVASAKKGRGTVLLPRKWRSTMVRGRLELCSPAAKSVIDMAQRFDITVPGTTECGAWGTVRAEILSLDEVRERIRSRDNLTACLDEHGVQGGLMVRPCEADDVFVPYGRSAVVRLREFLKKQGVDRARRDAMMVVVSGNEEIVWVPGVRTSGSHAVSDETRSVLQLTCTFRGDGRESGETDPRMG